MEKRGKQIFSKIVRASKLTRHRTLEMNNTHLDRSRCFKNVEEQVIRRQSKVWNNLLCF